MAPQDFLGMSFLAAFGVWWVLFPRSARQFYTAVHRRGVKLPTETGFRIAGALWLALLAVVALWHWGL